ncbi:hypothetical protein [Chryseobacterium turcicum]|uniref:DUF4468 domain-containing protein n=1 Tax=Chryseobacterium turcicum TaxID=2898076 RepID=A0A9Q3V6S1_9FLAO|nr:hypothetical protein [Chryseobacterium turcicum]MCD1118460.1 hypothetical protein [Chryseobacterium turcicum]
MTKKVKLAIVLLTTVASMNVNAQKKATIKTTKPKTEVKTAQTTESKTSEPTKQETMDWIGGKMKEKLAENRNFISYNNGVFVTSKTYVGDITVTISIDLNKVTGVSNEYSSDFVVSGTKLWSAEKSNDPGSLSYGQNQFISGPNYEDRDILFNFTPDQALVERLKKAFATLKEYNSTQKRADEKF